MKRIKCSYQFDHIKMRIPAIQNIVLAECAPYKIPELEEIKSALNKTKSKFDGINDVRAAAIFGQIDLYKKLRTIAEEKFNARHVTNAWLKFWELYFEYDVVRNENPNVFFNAELPGAALEAFNHYMKAYKKQNYNWVASSLVPGEITGKKGEALGDTYGLFESNREHWLMTLPGEPGQKNNGDATNPDNLHDFSAKCGPKSKMGGVHLYTHDAGVDPSGDYNNQETTNMFIHLGCALAGFMTLREGGIFIAKQYTFFETLTWNLLIIYATLFDEFYLSKPLTSRAANSEIYLIGIGFKGIPEKTLNLLLSILKTKKNKPIIKDVEFVADAAEAIINFGRTIYTQQRVVLAEAYDFYKYYSNNITALHHGLIELKNERCNTWMATYPLCKIRDEDLLPSKSN